MKKIVFLLALTFTSSIVLTSCREEKSGIEKVADDVEDAVDQHYKSTKIFKNPSLTKMDFFNA